MATTPPELDSLSDTQLRNIREAFQAIDKAGEGFITRGDVGPAMRALSLHPSEAEIKKACDEVAPNGKIEIIPFCVIVARQMGGLRNVPAMLRAFAAFDPMNTGCVTAAEFRAIFEKIGEIPVIPEIVDEMVAFADPEETGQVYYEPFVNRIFTEYEAAKKAKEAAIAAAKK